MGLYPLRSKVPICAVGYVASECIHIRRCSYVAVRLNMRQNIFDRYRTFSRGGSYQWMSEQGSNAKERNHL